MSGKKVDHDVERSLLLRSLEHLQQLDLLLRYQTVATLALGKRFIKECSWKRKGWICCTVLQHRHQTRHREREKVVLGANHDRGGEEQRLRDVANSETNSTSNLVDIHVRSAFQLHAVLLHTVTGIHRLSVTREVNTYVSVSVNKTRNDTTAYIAEKISVQTYPSRQFPDRTSRS